MMITVRLLIVLLISSNAFAGITVPEILVYRGREYGINNLPLECYFNNYPDKKPKLDFISTNLSRGYIGTYEIINNGIVVKDISILCYDTINETRVLKEKSVTKEVFPSIVQFQIDCFTGLVLLNDGEEIPTVNIRDNLKYTHYMLLEIKNGIVKQEIGFDFNQLELFCQKQFDKFKGTSDYEIKKKEFLQMLDNKVNDAYIDALFLKNILYYTNRIL